MCVCSFVRSYLFVRSLTLVSWMLSRENDDITQTHSHPLRRHYFESHFESLSVRWATQKHTYTVTRWMSTFDGDVVIINVVIVGHANHRRYRLWYVFIILYYSTSEKYNENMNANERWFCTGENPLCAVARVRADNDVNDNDTFVIVPCCASSFDLFPFWPESKICMRHKNRNLNWIELWILCDIWDVYVSEMSLTKTTTDNGQSDKEKYKFSLGYRVEVLLSYFVVVVAVIIVRISNHENAWRKIFQRKDVCIRENTKWTHWNKFRSISTEWKKKLEFFFPFRR